MRKKLISLIVLLLIVASCGLFSLPQRPIQEQGAVGNRLAVIGFEPALLAGQKPRPMRDPLTGSVFMAEAVKEDRAQDLTALLYRLVSQRGGYSLISAIKAREIMRELEGSDPGLSERPLDLYVKVGRATGANLVLVGYLYRWKKRRGEPYGVREAASVAFSLSLISVKYRSVLWSARFDKTQRSLSENLLDVRTFLKGRGKWMSAEELALVGLEKVIKQMPVAEGKDSREP